MEISTQDGHVVALDLPKTPYPLAERRATSSTTFTGSAGLRSRRILDRRSRNCRWTAWDAPVDGIEWLNADSEWREERPWTLARALVTYPFRPPQALALLLDHPEPVIRRWDELSQQRRVVGVAAADAHARVGIRSVGEPYDSAGSLHFPSYATSFREFSIALPSVQLTGVAAADARRVLDAIRAGAVYSTIDALAGPAAFSVTATSGSNTATMGETLPLAGPVHVRVDAQAPADARITLFRNGVVVANARRRAASSRTRRPNGLFIERKSRSQARRESPAVPWIVSNPIYVGRSATGPVTLTRRSRGHYNALRRRHSPRLDDREERGIRCRHRRRRRTRPGRSCCCDSRFPGRRPTARTPRS